MTDYDDQILAAAPACQPMRRKRVSVLNHSKVFWKAVCGVVCVLVVVFAHARPVSATTVLPVTFEQLVGESSAIVLGEVRSVRSEWRERGGERAIVTLVTVRVMETLKGNQDRQLDLEFIGGTVGDTTLEISDMPRFVAGEKDFFFVAAPGTSLSPLVGFFAGRWRIQADALTGREFVLGPTGTPLTSVTEVDSRPARSLSGMRRGSAALSVRDVGDQIREQVVRR